MTKEHDFVVFGATGFTGKYVCKELLKQSHGQNISIAVAGRSRRKLKNVVEWLQGNGFISAVEDVAIIEANVEDAMALVSMCKCSRVVLDCVGPYKLYGEPVVKACLEGVCDYIDITGEPEYIERIHTKYHEDALAKGVYIVSACGFDYIPSDMGIVFAKKNFNGTLATVENYFTLQVGRNGMKFNFGTYASVIHGLSDMASLRALRHHFSEKPLPVCGPKMKMKSIHYGPQGKLAIPFAGGDMAVVKRSQKHHFNTFKEIPSQFTMYVYTGIVQMLALLIFFVLLRVLTSFSWGKKMLLRYPEFFSAGIFGKQGPDEEQMSGCGFEYKMYCEGYRKVMSVEDFLDGSTAKKPLDAKLTIRISGPELAYVTTPITMVQSGLCIKEERSQMPLKGGVYTPGPAFKNTTLIERLHKNGIRFEVVQ